MRAAIENQRLKRQSAGGAGSAGPVSSTNTLLDIRKLFGAVKTGKIAEVRQLFSKGTIEVDTTDESGNTLLHWAAFNNQLEVMRFLVDQKNASLSPANKSDGQTPLHWAVMGGHPQCVAFLLNRGAHLFSVDKKGSTALHHAAQYDQALVACYLIHKGLTLDSLDNDGHTPLHWAAYSGHEHLCRMFLSQGADVNRRNLKGMTSLHLAAWSGHLPVFRLLVSAGAQVDAQDNSGRTPRTLANSNGHMIITHEIDRSLRRHPIDRARTYLILGLSFLPTVIVVFSLFPLLLSLLIAFGVYFVVRYHIMPNLPPKEEGGNQGMEALFLSTYLLSEYVYFFHLGDHKSTHYIETIVFLALQVWFWAGWCYFKWGSPGYLRQQTPHAACADLAQRVENGQVINQICGTCLVPRPLRSKHCRTCNRCVIRHDHHCSFLNRCVGQRNHVLFLLILFTIIILHAFYARILISFLLEEPGAPSLGAVFDFIYFVWSGYTPYFILILFHALNVMWQSYVIFWQVLGIRGNITTSEIMHMNRFFKDDGSWVNPYDRGVRANICELFSTIDYENRFSLTDTA